MISKKLALGYYEVPFNLVIVVTDLVAIMVKTKRLICWQMCYCGADSFQTNELVYVWQVVKSLPSLGFQNMIREYFYELRKSVIHHS